MSTRALTAMFSTSFVALAALAMDRPPQILEMRQVGETVTVLWAPGGDADGTLDDDVLSYTLQRDGLEHDNFTTVFPGSDETTMTFTDPVDGSIPWHPDDLGDEIRYRVRAATTGGNTAWHELSFVPSLPV